MKTLKLISLATLLLMGALAFGQTSLTQTTLASKQGAGAAGLASGNSDNYSTTVNLASATGVTAAFNGQPVTFILIGQEVEAIETLVTGQTTIFNVLRGQMGTKASPHPSGDMVLIQVVTPQFGGGAGSGGLQQTDPPVNGACTAANTLFTPWVNVNTGAQWLCSTVTNTWVPGWNNPYSGGPGGRASVTALVPSAAGTVTPSGPLFHINGSSAITGFNIPVGFNATALGGGCFTVISDTATYTWTAAGNISVASGTVVANKSITFCWDATNSKFVPSSTT